ncbi:MAG: DNA-processing protein DprA [Bacteroidales bacterium]|jgi:DNA processing protein|nr:DNA-processing protein DprA [Bacteroidales bacterium]
MENLYNIALTLLPGVGDKLGKVLVEHCGSSEAVFKEKKRNLEKIPDIGTITAQKIVSQGVLQRAEEELKFIEKYQIQTFFFKDSTYPRRLLHCADSPLMLYFKGHADLNAEKIISIVGTRKCTNYGRDVIEKLLADLKQDNVLVISGLAYGIDTLAHQTALNCDLSTVGVLGHGLDRIYPNQNQNLAKKMLEKGGLLTNFMSKTNPDAVNFPSRNRIIAGLSDAVVVVEAARHGGALITADIANTYNRDVFAVPGRLNDERSEGCNFLIKTNKAALIESAQDIRYLLNWDLDPQTRPVLQPKLFLDLPDEQLIVFNMIQAHPNAIVDELCNLLNMPLSKLSALLLQLEIAGIIEVLPGKKWRILRH